MTENILIPIIAGSFTTIVGLFVGEHLALKKEQKQLEQEKKNVAILLKHEINGLMDAIESYHHLCHRPFFNEEQEAICFARQLEKKSILALVLDDIQAIGENIVFFETYTREIIFDLKWAISDLIKTSNYICVNSLDIEKIDELEETLQLNLDMYIVLLYKNEDFMLKKCRDLITSLDVDFDLIDEEL